MALEPIVLDDLTWSALTTATRGRIPAASKGTWTLHAPVDPGVTLLELYAYLYEQRLFWMDQATPELSRALLALLGFQPRPAIAATTVMQFTTTAGATTIAEGTALWLARDPSIIFTTGNAVTVLPLKATRLFAGARDLTPELLHGREVEVFADGEAEVRIELDATAKPVAGDWLGILFLLETDRSIQPQWEPSSTAIAPGATLQFFYGDAASQWREVPELDDGTRGLRRSGIARIRVPNDWTPASVSGVHTYRLLIRQTNGTFIFPPRITALAPNTAIARHRRAVAAAPIEWTANDCPPLPGLVLPLPQDSFPPAPPLEETVTLKIHERDGEWHEWKRALDLTFAGPADRVFVVDRERRALLFGDGLTGRLPRPRFGSGVNVEVHYDAGGGAAGNVGAKLAWHGEGGAVQCDIVNLAPADAGAEPEAIAAARSRAAAALRTPDRAVTEPDYVAVATLTPGTAIVRAHAASGFHPCSPCAPIPGVVTLFVVPYAPRPADVDGEDALHYVAAPLPDRGTLEAVRKRIDAARLAGTEVYVAAPRYRAVRLLIELDTPTTRIADLHMRIFRRLRAMLDPLGDWPWGEPLRPAVLRRAAQTAAGTGAEIGSVAIGLDDAEPSEDCREVVVGPHDLVYLAELRLRVKAAPGPVGGLR